MNYYEKRSLIKIIKSIVIIIVLGIICHTYITSPSTSYKKLDKYLKKTYGEEFVIKYMGRRNLNSKEWYEARIIYPKSYIGTHKENDPYYWGTGFVEIQGFNLDPGDDYGAVLLKESANEFYGKKLKELFGENVLPIFELDWYYEKTNFIDEIRRRGYYITEEGNFYPLRGRIYIFGRVRDNKDKEWYRKQIYEFIKYMKDTVTFDYAILSINVIDERILADDALSYIEKIEKINDVNKDFDILNEAFEKTSKEDIKLKIENLPRTDTYELLNKYHGYLLFSSIVSPKKAKYITEERNRINYYEKVEDIVFEGETFEPKLEGDIVKEYGKDESYYITKVKNGMKNGESKHYDKKENVIWIGTYKDNLLQGEYTKYYSSGELLERGTYKDNLLHGKCKKYYINGKLHKEMAYKNNLLHGKYREYYTNGQLHKEGTYKNGKLDGVYKKFEENGNLYETAEYKNGDLDGIYRYYQRGILKKEIEYRNENSSIIERIFYDNGNLEAEINYVNGYENGLSKYYYENGNLKLEANMLNDRFDGIIKYYHENGNLERIYNEEDGEKVGEEKIYYPDGTLYIINTFEEYGKVEKKKVFNENGKLITEIIFDDFSKEIVKRYREDDGTLSSIANYDYYNGSKKWDSYYIHEENDWYSKDCKSFEEYDRNGNIIVKDKSNLEKSKEKVENKINKFKKIFTINEKLKSID